MHNLTANRDSITSLKIAEESTRFAHETRRDSDSMEMIAKLTMLYLPATVVSKFFGTNFLALDTNALGRPSLSDRGDTSEFFDLIFMTVPSGTPPIFETMYIRGRKVGGGAD
jgi:hypothetical protein